MALVEFYSSLENISGEKGAKRVWKRLREGGLVVVGRNYGKAGV